MSVPIPSILEFTLEFTHLVFSAGMGSTIINTS